MTAARRLVAGDPDNLSAQVDLCINLGRLRAYDESAAECSRFVALEGHADLAKAYEHAYRQHGYEPASLLIARKHLTMSLADPHPELWELANAYVSAGMKEETLQTLRQGLATHEPGLLQIRVDPDFDAIRAILHSFAGSISRTNRPLGFPMGDRRPG